MDKLRITEDFESSSGFLLYNPAIPGGFRHDTPRDLVASTKKGGLEASSTDAAKKPRRIDHLRLIAWLVLILGPWATVILFCLWQFR